MRALKLRPLLELLAVAVLGGVTVGAAVAVWEVLGALDQVDQLRRDRARCDAAVYEVLGDELVARVDEATCEAVLTQAREAVNVCAGDLAACRGEGSVP